MDLSKWELFSKVAEHGSLTRAAMMLDLAQSAISRQINALERECGGRLFLRTGRGVALTETGERILPRIRALLAEAEQIANDVRMTAGTPVGEVRLGVIPSIAYPLINTLVKRVRSQFPEVRLQLFEGSSGELDEMVTTGRVDIGVFYRYGKSLPANETSVAVVDTYLIGPIGDALTSGDTVRFSQLDGLAMVLPSAPNGLRTLLDQLMRRKNVAFTVPLEANSIPIMKDVVADGGGYTVMPLHAVLAEVQTGRLQASRLINPGIERIISLATTTHHPLTLAAREIANLTRRTADDLTEKGAWRQGRS